MIDNRQTIIQISNTNTNTKKKTINYKQIYIILFLDKLQTNIYYIIFGAIPGNATQPTRLSLLLEKRF